MSNEQTNIVAEPKRPRIKRLLSSALKISIAIVAFILLASVVLYFAQKKFIFYPQPISEKTLEDISQSYPSVEDITIETPNSIKLTGWFIKSTDLGRHSLIIYFGGNAEEVSYLISEAYRFNDWSLALINYRGYGLSEGAPSENALFSDAITIYEYFLERTEVDSERIVVMGRSLGTGVAVYLAQQKPVRGVILVSPYDSIISVAQSKLPFYPISLILNQRFDSLSRAPSIHVPALILVVSEDKIIPPCHSQKLAEAWLGPCALKMIENQTHNTIHQSRDYWKSINEFLSQFQSSE